MSESVDRAATEARLEQLRDSVGKLDYSEGGTLWADLAAVRALLAEVERLGQLHEAREEHAECPAWCDECRRWEMPRTCRYCKGSGYYCEDCGGDGRSHDDGAEASQPSRIVELESELEDAEAERDLVRQQLAAVEALADDYGRRGHTASTGIAAARCYEIESDIRAALAAAVPVQPEPTEEGA